MLKYLSIVSALVLMVCLNNSLAASPSGNDQLIAQQEEQKKEASDDLDDLIDLEEEEPRAIDDPIASWNHAMFEFNDKLYFYVLKPVGQVWKVIPTPFRQALKNAYYNIRIPIRFFNSLLQGKGQKAKTEALSFLINSTLGIGGLVDPAKKILGSKPSEEDFGQTLGVWDIDHGIYLVWPFFGPSTVRDSFGWAGDLALDPLFWFPYILSGYDLWPQTIAVRAGEIVNDVSFRIGDYESLKEAAIDPYEALKDAYLQYRKKKLED